MTAWVPFRSETVYGAKNMFLGMFGINGVSLPHQFQKIKYYLDNNFLGINFLYNDLGSFGSNTGIIFLLLLFLIVLFPQKMSFINHSLIRDQDNLKLGLTHSLLSAFFLYISIVVIYFGFETEFLYFQF